MNNGIVGKAAELLGIGGKVQKTRRMFRKQSNVGIDALLLAQRGHKRPKRPRRDAALRMERAGFAVIGAHDGPIRLTERGRAVARKVAAQLVGGK